MKKPTPSRTSFGTWGASCAATSSEELAPSNIGADGNACSEGRRISKRGPRGESVPCPRCGGRLNRVIDSRATASTTRRRRVCVGCHERFTTCEVVIDCRDVRPFGSTEELLGAMKQDALQAIARAEDALQRAKAALDIADTGEGA